MVSEPLVKMSDVRIISKSDVESCLSMKTVIQAVKEAYIAFSEGRVQMPPVMHLDVPKYTGEVDIKSGYIDDFGLIGTKIASGYYDNYKIGLPPGIALIVLLDLKTSMPLAIMDGTFITAYRTGAAGAVAASVLARDDSSVVGIIGAGTQARMQVLALTEILNIQEVKVWDIEMDNAKVYAKEMSGHLGITVTPHLDPEPVVRGSDIVVTVTPSRRAIVQNEWIEQGMHINAIGADGPGKQELNPLIVKNTDKIVVDSLSQCRVIGEIQHALKEKLITEKDIHAEIGQILSGEKEGRANREEVTLFDATGLSVQDIAAANIVYKIALKEDLGISFSFLE